MQPDTLRVALIALAVIVVLQGAIIAVLFLRAQRDRRGNLSEDEVENHKYQTMEALGVATTAELIKYAIEHRLIETS